jgi:hypothetical protein
VWFSEKSELQTLIDSLIELRDSVGTEPDHVHLQHHDLAPGMPSGLTEVMFFRPGKGVTDIDIDLIKGAASTLGRASKRG